MCVCVCVCVFVAIDKHASMISDLNKSGTHFLNGHSLPWSYWRDITGLCLHTRVCYYERTFLNCYQPLNKCWESKQTKKSILCVSELSVGLEDTFIVFIKYQRSELWKENCQNIKWKQRENQSSNILGPRDGLSYVHPLVRLQWE